MPRRHDMPMTTAEKWAALREHLECRIKAARPRLVAAAKNFPAYSFGMTDDACARYRGEILFCDGVLRRMMALNNGQGGGTDV